MPAASRTGIGLLTTGVGLVGAGYAFTIVAGSAPAWAPWAVAVGGSAATVAFFVLGAATRGPVGRGVGGLLVALFVVLATSFGAALVLPPAEGADAPLLLGLPVRLAIVFYGVGFVPLIALPLAFARTFRERPGR